MNDNVSLEIENFYDSIGLGSGQLKAKGYDGMVSLEVFRPEYWAMKPEELIPMAYETTRKVLEENECL